MKEGYTEEQLYTFVATRVSQVLLEGKRQGYPVDATLGAILGYLANLAIRGYGEQARGVAAKFFAEVCSGLDEPRGGN